MALPHGRLGADTVHLAIDMQVMFASGPWGVPALPVIEPRIAALARHRPGATLFARFTVPPTAEHATGAWRRYYARWHGFTGATLPPDQIALTTGLAALATPADMIDKAGYSAFQGTTLHARLAERGATALVVSGVETDVCVLGTVLHAVDLGYRVVIAADAVASGSEAGHAAILHTVLRRFDQQVEIADTDAILAAWSDA